MSALNTVLEEVTAALTRSPPRGLPWAPPDRDTVGTLGAALVVANDLAAPPPNSSCSWNGTGDKPYHMLCDAAPQSANYLEQRATLRSHCLFSLGQPSAPLTLLWATGLWAAHSLVRLPQPIDYLFFLLWVRSPCSSSNLWGRLKIKVWGGKNKNSRARKFFVWLTTSDASTYAFACRCNRGLHLCNFLTLCRRKTAIGTIIFFLLLQLASSRPHRYLHCYSFSWLRTVLAKLCVQHAKNLLCLPSLDTLKCHKILIWAQGWTIRCER